MNDELILSVSQMKYCEKYADEHGVSYLQLMENAGKALAQRLAQICTERGFKSVLILAGKGNNGGDGFVCAHHLKNAGINADIMLCCGAPATDISKAVFEKYREDISLVQCEETEYSGLFGKYDMLLDCIFGTGFKGSFREDILPLFRALEECESCKIACDIPSGVNADSGCACEYAFSAEETVTMHAVKAGMLTAQGRYLSGRVTVCEIGIPDEAVLEDVPECETLLCEPSAEYLTELLPERPRWGHKGTFGKLLCVCGSDRYIGAAAIAVSAALRTGAGLVELCSTEKVIASCSAKLEECIYTAVKTDSVGFITYDNIGMLLKKAETSTAILIGCGMGHTPDTERLVAELVEKSPVPVILDADGINSLAANIDVLTKKSSTVILTPHPAELGRLCGLSPAEVLARRLDIGHDLARRYGVVLVSKSSETIVFYEDKARLLRFGDTSLSKGGSGDMLAGMTGSFTAQQPSKCAEMAQLACFVMGAAAERLTRARSPRSVLASDIIASLPEFLHALETGE